MSIPPVMLLMKACLWILVVIGMIELNGFELIGIFSSYDDGMLMKGCCLVERILCLLVSVTMILIIILICKYNVQKCEHFDLLLVAQTFLLIVA